MAARRFAVMGFTEAELGFVVAALFAAIAGLTLTQRNTAAGDLKKLMEERDRLRADLARVQQELGLANEELRKLRELLAKNPISTKTPNCWEKGESREPVGEVSILGASFYQLDGRMVGVDEVRQRFAERISRGRELGCRFTLIVRASPDVKSIDHVTAVAPLRSVFDISDRAQ